jgi:chaperonin cofactor prefoldin
MGGPMETGLALAVASLVLGAVGLFYTVHSGLTRVERDRLNWLEAEFPRLRKEIEDKTARINELNEELFSALRRRAIQSE